MAFVELALGVVTSLVYDTLKKPFRAIASEVSRRDQIVRALADKPSPKSQKHSERLQKALEDLTRVVGNSEGKLTEDVARYLKSLERTAIPAAIAQSVLCGSNLSNIRKSFADYSNRFTNIEFDVDQLFNALVEAITARVEDVSDHALLEIIRAQHSDLTAKIDLVSQSISSSFSAQNNLTPANIEEYRLRVAKSIEAENRYLSIESLKGPKQVKLRTLAIPGRLIRLQDEHVQAAKVPNGAPTMAYLPFRRALDKSVILGDPGGGKSTLTQLLSYDLANSIILDAANPGRRDIVSEDIKLPLKVVLRRYEVQWAKHPSYSIFDYLCDQIKVSLDNDTDLSSRFLKHVLGLGEVILIFDGLDEILNVGSRIDIIRSLEKFTQVYAACPVLVTSRLVGYRDAPLNSEFNLYGLDRFNTDEILKYTQKSISAVAQLKVAPASQRASEFLRQTNTVGVDLRHNPLMLGLMVQIFLYRGDVPSNKPEVYKECATLMFEKWDGHRQIIADVPRHDMELLDVFGYVASRTYGNADTEEGVSKKWLTDELRKHFEGWYIDKASANRAATSLVTFLTGRAWVMSEVGPDTFKFTHRTFLEFFFARNLLSEARGVEELVSIDLLPRIIRNEWAVISHLALHMAVFRNGGKSKQAADALERAVDRTDIPAREELALLNFVISAFDYLVISEGSYISILNKVVARAIQLGSSEDGSAAAIIQGALSTAKNRGSLAAKNVMENLSKSLQQSQAELLFCMYFMGYKGENQRHRRFLEQGVDAPVLEIIHTLKESHRELLQAAAERDVAVARAFINVYEDNRYHLYKIHGVKLLELSISPLVPPVIDLHLANACEFIAHWALSQRAAIQVIPENILDCQNFVKEVADDIVLRGEKLSHDRVGGREREQILSRAADSAIEHCLRIAMTYRNKRLIERFSESIGDVLICSFAIREGRHFALADRSKNTGSELFLRFPESIGYALLSITKGHRHEKLLESIILRHIHKPANGKKERRRL